MESRFTYRNKKTVQAWQYDVRLKEERKFIESGKYRFYDDLDLDLKNAIVKEVSRKTAQKIILTYEWLGDMAITNLYYGIFFGDFCGGVICINTNGVCYGNGRSYGVKDSELSYFARGACAFWTPKGSASKLLSIACKLEKKRGAKVCIGYADTDAGEYGTVYQASNWLCLGRQKTTSYQYFKGTKILDSRSISQKARNYKTTIKNFEKHLRNNGWKKQRTNRKYIYIRILKDKNNSIYNHVKDRITQYPKRVTSE